MSLGGKRPLAANLQLFSRYVHFFLDFCSINCYNVCMGYESLLDVDGFLPSFPTILSRKWSAATASEIRADMPHCVMEDPVLSCLRFEIRNTPDDYASDDRRRSEISTLENPDQQVVNGQSVWNTYLFKMPAWSDPAAMKAVMGSSALCISQLKPNSGGSPTRAHRLTSDGYFQATTTASSGGTNVKRYTGSVRMDDSQAHRIVERIVPHASNGRWELWLDGQKIVDFTGPMGASTDGYSPSFGIYSAGGIGCDISIEYADIQILSPTSLEALVADRTWPTAASPLKEPILAAIAEVDAAVFSANEQLNQALAQFEAAIAQVNEKIDAAYALADQL